MNKKTWSFTKIIISLILVIFALVWKFDKEIINNILFVMAYLIVGYDVLLKAVRNIFKGKIFDENFLMTVATVGAFFISEIPEAVAVMLFYQIGELFQSYAVNKSRKSIASLMDIRPDYANVIRDGKTIMVLPDEVLVGELLLVKPGEKVSLDGIVVSGESTLNTSALTGEVIPRRVKINDEVLSGCINNDSTLKIKVTKEFGESTVSKILDLLENAGSCKSKSERFITKFAKYYTPIVVIAAIILAVLPPLVIRNASFGDSLYRSLSFLVVSCPCALVISIPLSFFGGIGAASKTGVLIKGSNYLEALSKLEIIVCDKTGTLTEGTFKVQKILPVNCKREELLRYATLAECYSNHPISLSLKEFYRKEINEKLVAKTEEIAGFGIISVVDGKEVIVGNEKLFTNLKVDFLKSDEGGTVIYVAVNKKFMGTIIIADKIKDDSYKAIDNFKNNNLRVVMLTGDRVSVSENVAKTLNIEEYYAELLPQDKVSILGDLMQEKSPKGKLAFVGDGINDAPVLAMADIGIAMGALGCDAAIEASDIVIMSDEVSKISEAVLIAKKTIRIVKQNIILALFVKIGVLFLSALGLASMWAAVFADVGVSVIAIINALRILIVKKN